MNKLAVITGATSGIGEASARKFHQLGYQLIITGRREDRLKKLQSELGGENRTQIAVFDIRDQIQVAQFIQEFRSQLKSVDLLLNNSGLAKGVEPMHEAKLEDWNDMMETNVLGLLYLTHGVLPFMLARNSGHIINMGSVAGRFIYPGGGVYCASKFAVRAITEGLRMDLLGKNIRVSNIEPGMVETEFSVVRFGNQQKADAVYKGMKPLTPQDIAETIAWIAERPPHVNIQELVIYPTDQAHVGMVSRTEHKV